MTSRRQLGTEPGTEVASGSIQAPGVQAQRLDRWLWFARAAKSRTVAAAQIEAGKIRVNAVKVTKPSHAVKPGDVVTSAMQRDVRILRVTAPGVRRGPASEAQCLYEDLTPKPAPAGPLVKNPDTSQVNGTRDAGSGRPTKRDRRLMDRLRGSD